MDWHLCWPPQLQVSSRVTNSDNSYFFAFISFLALATSTLLALCISNLVLHWQDLRDLQIAEGVFQSSAKTFRLVLKEYPMSLIILFYTFIVSMAFGLAHGSFHWESLRS